jgi:hypothetical protein
LGGLQIHGWRGNRFDGYSCGKHGRCFLFWYGFSGSTALTQPMRLATTDPWRWKGSPRSSATTANLTNGNGNPSNLSDTNFANNSQINFAGTYHAT